MEPRPTSFTSALAAAEPKTKDIFSSTLIYNCVKQSLQNQITDETIIRQVAKLYGYFLLELKNQSDLLNDIQTFGLTEPELVIQKVNACISTSDVQPLDLSILEYEEYIEKNSTTPPIPIQSTSSVEVPPVHTMADDVQAAQTTQPITDASGEQVHSSEQSQILNQPRTATDPDEARWQQT